MYSKFSNCRLENNDSNPFSNVLNVSSKRTASEGGFNVTDCANVNEEQIEELYAKLAEIEESKNDSTDEDFTDNSIAHIAYSIENKVMLTKKFNCSLCNLFLSKIQKSRKISNSNPQKNHVKALLIYVNEQSDS